MIFFLSPSVTALLVARETPAFTQQRPIPPLDPRLVAPAVQETTVAPKVSLPVPGTPNPNAPATQITADEAARLAVMLQPNVAIAKSGIAVQQGLTRQVRAGLMPRVTVITSYTRLQTLKGPASDASGPPMVTTAVGGAISLSTGIAAEATLNQLVFDFNHTLNLVRQSAALETVAAKNLTAVQLDTVLSVKQAFYVLVQSLRQVKVQELDVEDRQSQLDLARSRYNVGLGIPSDVVTAETAKAESVVVLSQAQTSAVQARVSLATLMGLDPRTPIEPADTTEKPSVSDDETALTMLALLRRPEVAGAQANLRSAQFGLSAARTSDSPAVSVGASAIASGDEFFPQDHNLTIGVMINWAVVDGGLRRGLVEQASGSVGIARSQLFAAQQTVKSDVANAYVSLKAAEVQMAAVLAGVTNAELGVRIATGRFSKGIGLFLDIINAQEFLLTARTNLVITQSAIEQYRAALSHAIGAPP